MKKILLLFLLSFTLCKASAEASIKLPILLYHNVTEEEPTQDLDLHISKDRLESHFKAIREQGYQTITFAQYFAYRNHGAPLPENPVILSFDDGYLSNYELAYPLLLKYQLHATFFVVTQSSYHPFYAFYPHFNWWQASEMLKSGLIDIESHSYTHAIHSELSSEKIMEEARKSYYDILINTKRIPFVYAYPTGRFSKYGQEIVKNAGYQIQVTVTGGINNDSTPLNALRRMNVSGNITAEELLTWLKPKN